MFLLVKRVVNTLLNTKIIKPLMLPKMSEYIKSFDKNKYMYFFIKADDVSNSLR